MRTIVVSFVAGLIFAVGLGIAGMTQADKVIGFLDVAGNWDPSLAFVMIGAIGTHAVLRLFIVKRSAPILADRFQVPARVDIDRPLVIGAALFGVGWAIGGYCPGPGLVSVASGSVYPLVFVATMTLAMVAWSRVQHAEQRRSAHEVRVPGISDPQSINARQ